MLGDLVVEADGSGGTSFSMAAESGWYFHPCLLLSTSVWNFEGYVCTAADCLKVLSELLMAGKC